ncbi:hypothetical protein T492DRAFT_888122 [Pavlovales sp. CCMP2436]|nr:hypothetical protein T492DRAFT_888122 [Pavlovales sp. CCMP2436]
MAIPILISARPANPAVDGGGALRDRALLIIRGEGASGALVAEPALVDFKTILVGDMSSERFVLKNSSGVDLHYELEFEVTRSLPTAGHAETAAELTSDNAPYIEAARALLCEESTD